MEVGVHFFNQTLSDGPRALRSRRAFAVCCAFFMFAVG